MELPVTAPAPNGRKAQYIITTKNLSYKLPQPYGGFGWWPESAGGGTNRYILRNVNCEAKPGEITAIAGPSGAGKTTLLDILAGMIVPSRVCGHVLVNGQPMDAAFFRRVSGYITQDEALFPLLTVEETLIYSARLRLEGGLQKAAAARAKQLLEELGLNHVADAKIGDDSRRGISGGEKRRVSIGVDLVHNPDVLLVDEPTSGLDSASAFHVISLLKSMSKNHGKTIVLTIHQPGFRILELFDQAVLLCNGIVLHRGSLNLLEERLKLTGHSIPCHVNVLEFAIDAVESLLIDVEENPAGIEEEEEEEGYRPFRKGLNRAIYCNSRFSEAVILSQRFSKNIFRTKQLFSIRMVQALLVGILLGTIFMNSKLKFQPKLGFFAFSLTFLMSSTTEALPILLREKRILMRETSRGAYRVSSYVIANTLVFLPFLLGVALLFSTPVYWLVGLRRDLDCFLYFSLVVWVVLLMSNSLVACFSALVPDFIVGTSVIAGFVGSFFLFSGYFISKDEIPKYWIFMYYLSLFRYPFECFMINEYGGERGKGKCLENVGGACVLDSHGFLLQKGLKESQKWSNLAVMLGFILGYRFLCFMILWYRSYRTKG